MKFRTRAIHAGQTPDAETGAVVPPLHVATTFVQPGVGEWGAYDYSRSGNPTRKAFEEGITSLEEGVGGLAFSTGMAAIHAVTMLLGSGDHVVAGSDIYGGAYRLFHKICNRAGVAVTLANASNLDALGAAFRPETKLLWLESPGNPLLSICDLKACAALGKERGALVGVDTTFATPVLTRPLELGVDVVMHSATKYLSGHSDAMGGALVTADQSLFDRLYFIQNATGAVMGPFESFLCSRGLKTLELRVLEQCRSAMKIADYLHDHKQVAAVHYPGLADHPGHEIAARQMRGGFGAMLSFELAGDFSATKRFVESTRLFRLAVSLGAVESLIEQPAGMSHASYDAADRAAAGISDNLIRLSVGLEHVDDLLADLDVAFAAAGA